MNFSSTTNTTSRLFPNHTIPEQTYSFMSVNCGDSFTPVYSYYKEISLGQNKDVLLTNFIRENVSSRGVIKRSPVIFYCQCKHNSYKTNSQE